MRFAKVLPLLALPFALWAQDDFIQNEGQGPNVNGLFDEELEQLDQPPVQNPEPTATPMPSRSVDYPEPKTVKSSPSKSGKGLPDLPTAAVPRSNEKLRMDFVQVEIEELVKYFGERLKKKFIYDPSTLQGKITIISPTEVTLHEAWGAFLSALEVRGYIVFPVGSYLKLEKAANARKAPVPVIEGSTPNDDSYVTRIVMLKYLQVNDIQQAVRTLLSRTGGDLITHNATNTLIISDYAFNIKRIIRILDILDVEGFQEQIEIIALRNASAQDIARKVTDFFPSAGGAGGPGGVAGLRRRGSGGSSDGVIQKIVPDERTNSVIVLGSERGIEQVKKFIARIDVPTENGGGRIHVYPVQNVKAEEISATLASLASGQKDKRLPSIPMPLTNPTTPGGDLDVANLGDVKITADKATNSLVIQSSPRDFEVLKTIIRKLDIRRRQVFIEGAILEARVTRNSEYGMQFTGPLARTSALGQTGTDGRYNESGFVGTLNGMGFDSLILGALKNPASLTGMALGFRSGGNYNVTYTDAAGNPQTAKLPLLSAILKLSALNTDVNVISTPHILATANEEASILIGTEIPQQAGTETTTGGNVSRNITRLRVATELKITPQINSGDYITLKINQKIDDAGESTDLGVTTTKREAATTVIVKDEQTVVIGGLMRDVKKSTISKVPFLGDIPILGWLFKTRSSQTEKVNLLLFLTPYIIRNTGDMNDQFFRKLKEREGFLKDIGLAEKKEVPSKGLTEEQLKMLDPNYVKSLQKHTESTKRSEEEPQVEETPSSSNGGLTPASSNTTAPATHAPTGSEVPEKIFVPRSGSDSGSHTSQPLMPQSESQDNTLIQAPFPAPLGPESSQPELLPPLSDSPPTEVSP